MPDGDRLYLIANQQDGDPFELFVRHDAPELFEWTTALSVLITRLLRAGERLEDIAAELREIHSPLSGHMIPGTSEWCPGLVARIGRELQRHADEARRTPALCMGLDEEESE